MILWHVAFFIFPPSQSLTGVQRCDFDVFSSGWGGRELMGVCGDPEQVTVVCTSNVSSTTCVYFTLLVFEVGIFRADRHGRGWGGCGDFAWDTGMGGRPVSLNPISHKNTNYRHLF